MKRIFFDIETVSGHRTFDEMPERFQDLWHKKYLQGSHQEKYPSVAEFYRDQAGLYAEFGKIVCATIGGHNKEGELVIHSYADHDEKKLLLDFNEFLQKSGSIQLIGHNINSFDIPYTCQRMIVHRIKPAQGIDPRGKKPWEIAHIDTMENWKFGNWKGSVSLDLLTACLDIESPKSDINGAEVGRVYWDDNDLPRIAQYCERDVKVLPQVIEKLLL